MTAAVAHPTAAPAGARLTAFCTNGPPEVFHSVAGAADLWRADPLDVDTIHAPARAAFEHLLHRAARVPPPPGGAVLMLQGDSGSGKTHLMRAFRTRAHGQGLGYCGYMPMTSAVGNYARYMLQQLIDGLEQPYSPDGPPRTGLSRLSAALLEMVPGLTGPQAAEFREADGDVAALADDYADRLAGWGRFKDCDLGLLRVLLYHQRADTRVRGRVLMWLRCEEMRAADRAWIGDAVPRTDEAAPLAMLRHLARLTDAVHGVPLVLLIDQLEDLANQSAPLEQFRRVIDAVTAFTDHVPNTVVVVAGLEDYFTVNVPQLQASKRDRLTRDPDPVKLTANRSADDIRDMLARRLAHLYAEREADTDSADPLFPFRPAHLVPLGNLRTRDVLDYFRRHQEKCVTAGRWVEPDTPATTRDPKPIPPVVVPPPSELAPLWNDFHSVFKANVPDDEDELAELLTTAVRHCNGELADGFHFGDPQPDGRYIEVETHKPGNVVEKLLVALCNKNPKGGGMGKQVTELERRAGEIPVALVRTNDFPGATTQVGKQIGKLLKKDGRRVVAETADLRRMLAFDAFHKQHAARPDFKDWQRSARPLSELKSLQDILRLKALQTAARPAQATAPPPPMVPPPVAPPAAPVSADHLRLGQSTGLRPAPVTVGPDELIQHAAFLGGSGSGKTTAALNLIEQLLARGVPAVLVDRKGDLCRYADPAAWTRPLPPDRDAARRALRDKLDIAVFTPGQPRGRQLALPVVPPGFAELPQAEREQYAQYAAAALGGMMGFKPNDTDRGQLAILTQAVGLLAELPGAALTVPALRGLVGGQDEALIAATDGGYPARFFDSLAQRLLTLELNNTLLFEGAEKLDVDTLLGTGRHATPGRVRLSVVSTRFLANDAQRDFWVAQLLVAVNKWCGVSPARHLQAVFLFDEADVYLPAGMFKPAAKAPMENLLKRSRSAGVGVFLATQSPGDFDYRCKENVRTWVLGRIQQPQALDKLKPLLAAARTNIVGRLAGQTIGEFHLVREASVTPVRSDESLVATEQLAEERILALASGGR